MIIRLNTKSKQVFGLMRLPGKNGRTGIAHVSRMADTN